jgi:hypothetical protein
VVGCGVRMDVFRSNLSINTGYHQLFSSFLTLCTQKDFASANQLCFAPPLAKLLPAQQLADSLSFLDTCGAVTQIGAVAPHPLHPTANNNNSFVCTVQLARERYGKRYVQFELGFWRDKISRFACPNGVQVVALNEQETKLQTEGAAFFCLKIF